MRRFKNEISFLERNKHRNIVTVIDYGVSRGSELNGPFYVMRKYQSSLRPLMEKGIPPDGVLPLFSQILNGVEAAHMQGVVHRDLNRRTFYSIRSRRPSQLQTSEFEITEDILATLVESTPEQRLANFLYAAPEQRTPRQPVGPQQICTPWGCF